MVIKKRHYFCKEYYFNKDNSLFGIYTSHTHYVLYVRHTYIYTHHIHIYTHHGLLSYTHYEEKKRRYSSMRCSVDMYINVTMLPNL